MDIKKEKFIKDNFLVVTDYGWLPDNLEESWVHKMSDNYLIYDRKHRYEESDKVKHQINVGQNVYDIFDYIVEYYDNLPETIIFCRGCIMRMKDPADGITRLEKDGKTRMAYGSCTEAFFKANCNNKHFTELQDHTSEPWRINWQHNAVGPENSYCELNTSFYLHSPDHPGKIYHYVEEFLQEMYKSPKKVKWFRFAPAANYIIPRKNILKNSKKFYEEIKRILSYGIRIGEAHMIERCMWLIFNVDWEVNEKYK